jgi:hypothetical protein
VLSLGLDWRTRFLVKSCPSCNRTYPDDTLAFCLVDGSVLSPPYESDQTQQIPPPRATSPPATEVLRAPVSPGGQEQLQSTIHAPAPQLPPQYRPSISEPSVPRRSIGPWLLVSTAVLIVGILGIVMIAIRFSPDQKPPTTNQPSPTVANSVAPTSEKACGHSISAALYKKWIETGGETGKLGCPVTDQTEAPASPQGSTGRWIQFAHGDGGYLIEYTRPDDGPNMKPTPFFGRVFEVSGCMFKLYSSFGGTKSWLGFPITDGRETATGAQQDFEAGFVVWDRKTYVCDAKKY